MKKKIVIPTILFITILIFSFFILLQEKNKKQQETNKSITQKNQEIEQNQIILFYSDNCSHCMIVKKYIEDNKIENKISFTQKEIYNNQANTEELKQIAITCEISINSIGVPFLWNGSKCFMGDQDIINFFKSKISI